VLLDDGQRLDQGEPSFYHVTGLLCEAGLQRQPLVVFFGMRDQSSFLQRQQLLWPRFAFLVELKQSCDVSCCQGACLLPPNW
jgi:hypothetical protein